MAPPSRTVTRKDVAKLAGVSETIVSYVLNNNRYVAQEKRERVLAAVSQLHYRPNSIARALKGKGSSHILFIADNIANEYFGRLVQAIDSAAYGLGYLVSLMGVQNNRDFISRILAHRVDAVIISSATLDERYIQELVDAGLPVVLLMTRDYATLRGPIARIYTGIESGIMAAVRLMYESGCRHIVYVDRVSESGHFSSRQDMRYRGFCNQMESLGLPLSEDSFVSGCTSYDSMYNALTERLQTGAPVDGFVCRNDQLACMALEVCQVCHRAVPEEICITGFDNASVGQAVRPTLTTIAQDQQGIAEAALTMITAMVGGELPADRHFVTHMITGGTTR